MTITNEFYQRWCGWARLVRPAVTPPSKEQLEELISVLPEDAQKVILTQFDEVHSA